MALPKYRIGRTRRLKRRSHHALGVPARNQCPECGQTKQPHRVCMHCGYYAGRKVMAGKDDA
ncbi:MAG: 50S ribosomal protein L32 [bacterium]|nr:50S ribosomal protein L32 [Gemmatimonadota bacterium]